MTTPPEVVNCNYVDHCDDQDGGQQQQEKEEQEQQTNAQQSNSSSSSSSANNNSRIGNKSSESIGENPSEYPPAAGTASSSSGSSSNNSGNPSPAVDPVVTFPVKLHDLLGRVDKHGLSHIISWAPHGRCFLIHKKEEFTKYILPKWFRQTQYTSFQRQLNIYHFKRITSGPDKGAYYHELFLRGRLFLCYRMNRMQIKGCRSKGRHKAEVEAEPNFYAMKPCNDDNAPSNSRDTASTLASSPSSGPVDPVSVAAAATAAASESETAGINNHNSAKRGTAKLLEIATSSTNDSTAPAHLLQQQQPQPVVPLPIGNTPGVITNPQALMYFQMLLEANMNNPGVMVVQNPQPPASVGSSPWDFNMAMSNVSVLPQGSNTMSFNPIQQQQQQLQQQNVSGPPSQPRATTNAGMLPLPQQQQQQQVQNRPFLSAAAVPETMLSQVQQQQQLRPFHQVQVQASLQQLQPLPQQQAPLQVQTLPQQQPQSQVQQQLQQQQTQLQNLQDKSKDHPQNLSAGITRIDNTSTNLNQLRSLITSLSQQHHNQVQGEPVPTSARASRSSVVSEHESDAATSSHSGSNPTAPSLGKHESGGGFSLDSLNSSKGAIGSGDSNMQPGEKQSLLQSLEDFSKSIQVQNYFDTNDSITAIGSAATANRGALGSTRRAYPTSELHGSMSSSDRGSNRNNQRRTVLEPAAEESMVERRTALEPPTADDSMLEGTDTLRQADLEPRPFRENS